VLDSNGGIKMIIKLFPRSWIQIKLSAHILYIDPSFMSSYYKKYPKIKVFSEIEDDSLPEDLEKAVLILISHVHKDHCKEVTINRLSNENTIILTPRKYKKEIDGRIKIIAPSSKFDYEEISVEIVDAYNTIVGNSTKKVHKKGECVGYIITAENKRIYFLGDTDFIPEMKDINNIDIAFIPIGGTFTMDINEALDTVAYIKPHCVIPIHQLKVNPEEFKKRVEESHDIIVKVLDIGEEFIV